MGCSQTSFDGQNSRTGEINPEARPDQPRVLVLLATYNGSRWVREQVESILGQRDVQVTIAIRDDVSTDGTRWELARFAQDARVRIALANAPSGSGAQNFLALIHDNPAHSFDFVALADQDDLWDPDKLRRACRTLASGESAGYSSATLAVWEDGRERQLKLSGPPTASDFLFEGAGQGCTFALTAAFYERVRDFLAADRELTARIHYHDWLIYALARSWGLRWHFDGQPSMRYRQHSENDTGARGTFKGTARRLARIRNGWYGTQLRAIAQACRAAAPANMTVAQWHRKLLRPDGLWKRAAIARFCLSGGRRRAGDNLVTVVAALCGWI